MRKRERRRVGALKRRGKRRMGGGRRRGMVVRELEEVDEGWWGRLFDELMECGKWMDGEDGSGICVSRPRTGHP